MQFERTDTFEAAYDALTKAERRRVVNKLRLFAGDFRHPSLRAQRWSETEWYFRVSRDIRLYYEMDGELCRLLTVGHHDSERSR